RGRRRLDCAEQVRQWMQAAGVAMPSVEALLAVRQPIAERLLPKAPPMPGAVAVIASCTRLSIPMALVTSSSREGVALKQAPHPWLAAVEERVYGDDPQLAAGKPAPDPYRLAARRLGVEASQCWAFEDSLAGAQSAAAAGCLVHVLLPQEPLVQGLMDGHWPAASILLHSLVDFDWQECCLQP
ncbi:MAG: HAD family hydrolase, partial [Cyanobacteria bacterium M_surface_9_m1_291]|nr:HAD family hydrolase [Cyanobacteria bacterium M_surface_9_m1_291]